MIVSFVLQTVVMQGIIIMYYYVYVLLFARGSFDMKNKNDVNKRKYFSLPDLLIVAVVVGAVLLGCFRLIFPLGDQGLVCVVKVDGEVFEEIPLSSVREKYEYKISGDSRVVLCVSPEGVWFKESDCPDKLCINTGVLNRAGQSAVCLPERVSVTLTTGEPALSADVPDAVVG